MVSQLLHSAQRLSVIPLTVCAFLVLFGFSLTGVPLAQAEGLASLYSAEGKIEGTIAPASSWEGINKGQEFQANDKIRTGRNSRAGIRFTSGHLIRLSERTSITFDAGDPGENTSPLSIQKGIGYFFSRTSQKFPKVTTPQVSASIRGTEFVVEVREDTTLISVLEGVVAAENQYGSLTVARGEQAITKTGQAPVKRLLVNPSDAVQWALYYPALIDLEDYSDFPIGSSPRHATAWQALEQGKYGDAERAFVGEEWRDVMGRSLIAYRQGDTQRALEEALSFRGNPPSGFSLYLASLYLSAGQVEPASFALSKAEQALARANSAARPKLATALYSQQAVVALTKNNKSEALSLSKQALEVNSESLSANLVSAYVYQAHFDMEGARQRLENAVRIKPNSSFARARLAELLLGFGEHERALSELSIALEQNSENAYAHTVQGFAELTRYRTSEAKQSFARALEFDQSLALPHLGMGLAMIRDGELEAGRAELELAVHLDPQVALYRSYLGKAYFEEEKDELSRSEYTRAIEIDPEDPTPNLYRSFLNLSNHRPIEALTDLQQSVEKNDNRAVFRSSFLLDQDQGTRSSGLGRIYRRLGFVELARIEAIKALNSDYSNYSAHFLLADLYRDTHLNSRAQTTENLLGRLLVPVNFNANSLSIGGEASLNEYTTLFDRPVERSNVQASHDTQVEATRWRGDYTMASNTLGLNLGYAGSYRDGFRDNDFVRQHQIFNLGQYQISETDTLLWDAALTYNDQGDVVVNFDPESEDKDFSSEFSGGLLRGGYHRRISPGVHLVAQTFYNYGDFDNRDRGEAGRLTFFDVSDGELPAVPEPFSFDGRSNLDTDIKQHLWRGDVQLIWDTEIVSFVSGVSARWEHLDGEENSVLSDAGSDPTLAFLDGFPIFSSDEVEQNSGRGFLYSTWHLTEWLDLDAGLVFEHIELSNNAFDPPFIDRHYTDNQFSPKAGFQVYLSDGTTLRGMYSETLDRTQRGGIGPLEPTFVGGFNQVFDGVRGSKQQLFGIGLDQKFSPHTYAGVSYQRRELRLRSPVTESGLDFDRISDLTMLSTRDGLVTGNADIDRVGAYLYQIVNNSVSLTMKYDWEKFKEEAPFPETATVRSATELNYFHSNGLFGFGRATFRYQELAGVDNPSDYNDFWILDAGVGYELDNRHGALTLSFKNLFDQSFRYSAITDEDVVLPRFGAELDLSFNF